MSDLSVLIAETLYEGGWLDIHKQEIDDVASIIDSILLLEGKAA